MFNRKSLLAVALLCAAATPAFAQTKIAIANPAKIFAGMQETKDIGEKMDAELKTFRDEVTTRQAKIGEMQKQRDDLKSDSPQYAEADNKLNEEKAAFDTWGKTQQASIQRRQKDMTRRIYDKIIETINEVAKEKGFDLVLSAQIPEIPNNMDGLQLNQLQGMLLSRNVLFSNPDLDLTDGVITRLDAKYKDGK